MCHFLDSEHFCEVYLNKATHTHGRYFASTSLSDPLIDFAAGESQDTTIRKIAALYTHPSSELLILFQL